MDFVSPILDIASRLWDCIYNRVTYIRELPENLNSLRNALQQLKNVCADVKEKVDREEKLHKKRTHAVDGWIKSVEAMENDVNALLSEGDKEIQNKFLGTCCPKNCRASYKMGKRVRAKIEDVASKTTEGLNFSVVAEPVPAPPVIERPMNEMVGVDSFFNHVCMQLQDEKVTKLGLYGIGGVGKTTLLNRINNEFLKTRAELDIVIWVTVSKPTNVEKIQRDVFDRLEILGTKWDGRSEDRRKEEIFNVLKCKNFVLLLDDVWEPLDLLAMGIPPLHDGSGSKVVMTTRFSSVCRDMGAKAVEVKSLAWEDAFALFQNYVGEETINSHPQIRKLAEMAARECDGLPLALIVIGRAMAEAKTPEEWEKKIQLLKKYPEKFPGMEKHLFTRLAFSYDSLPDETTKMCFLYCSLFPEDYEIPCDELIQLWIGEGFLDEYNNIKEAKNGGEEIIANLSHACLLEEGTPSDTVAYFYGGAFVKMHDVIRDMALWLACYDGNKKQNKFVVANKSEFTASEIEKWKEAQRISLFQTSFEEHLESPSFSNLRTLILCQKRMTLPIGFFNYMSNIRVLNFSYLGIYYLPVEIGKLFGLRYLNLTATGIMRIPKELGKLEGLRCLILDEMYNLEDFPSGILSGLSSLQLFSFGTTWSGYRKWMAMILEELEGLKCIEEVSINLHDVLSMRTLMNSHKLSRCLKFLFVRFEDCVDILQLSSRYLEKLRIWQCSGLKDVVVNLEKEGGAYAPSNSPRYQPLSQLSRVMIMDCDDLKKLTCLVYAPNLKILIIGHCGSLEEVIQVEEECGNSSEIKCERNDDVFSRLSYLYLTNLGNLRSICRGGNLLFPSLRVMEVSGCPRLRKLPFHSDITRRRRHMHLEKISGPQKWWDRLEWEDPSILHHFTPYFNPIRISIFD